MMCTNMKKAHSNKRCCKQNPKRSKNKSTYSDYSTTEKIRDYIDPSDPDMIPKFIDPLPIPKKRNVKVVVKHLILIVLS